MKTGIARHSEKGDRIDGITVEGQSLATFSSMSNRKIDHCWPEQFQNLKVCRLES